MNNTFYFLRHGHTQIDKNIPVSQWVLSERGEQEAQLRADEGVFADSDIIFSSTEKKAYQTALSIAKTIGKEIIQLEEICELDRDAGGFMPVENYEKAVKECLKNPAESVHSWETASHALERFSKKIEELDKQFENRKILIVGHGFTINMYFAKILNVLDQVYNRMNTNDFCDWGSIQNKKVIKDIANMSSSHIIDKIAWIYIKDRKVLSTRSKGKDVWYIPGGKREIGETDQETLIREIKEELSVDIIPETIKHLHTFQAQAHGKAEGVIVQMACYMAEYKGTLLPASEIEEMTWLSAGTDPVLLAPVDIIILAYLKEHDIID